MPNDGEDILVIWTFPRKRVMAEGRHLTDQRSWHAVSPPPG